MNNSAARRAVPVVLLCAAVGWGVSGCRVGGDDSAAVARVAAADCGEIRWGQVTRERTLIAVSRPVEVGKDDGWVTIPLVRVRELEPGVETSGAGPSTKRLFASLEKRLGPDHEGWLARPGKPSSVREHDDHVDFEGAGSFVSARAVVAVDGSFAADCAGTTVYGTVTSWYGNSTASLACGVDPATEGSDEKWVAEAYELACGDGS